MKELASVFLAFVSVISYFMVSTRLPFYQKWPVVHFLGCFIACGFLIYLMVKEKDRLWRRAIALAAALFLTGAFTWYVFDYSAYAGDGSVAMDTVFAAQLTSVALASHTGEEVNVFRSGDRGTLLVFYRGHW